MGSADGEPAWRGAEASYDDAVIDETTLPAMFEATVERHPTADAQLYKGGVYERSLTDDIIPSAPEGEYQSISYERMAAIVRRLAAGFRSLGVADGLRVGMLASTRMEWGLTDFALLAAGGVVTTVYTDSSPEQVSYLLDDPDASGVVVANRTLLERVQSVEDDLDLEFIVVMDECETSREDVYTLADIHELGAEAYEEETYRSWIDELDLDDLASIIYTSGTTGQPKGVTLTHWNFRVNVNQVHKRLGPRPDKAADVPRLEANTRSVSFLPLAHVFERLAGHYTMFGIGAAVGYAESPDTLADDIQLIQPTFGASVPRVYERIYDAMREEATESPVTAKIFSWAMDVASTYQRTAEPGVGLRVSHAIADRLVYSKLKERLGGNLEFMVSGGGSLSTELCRRFNGMGITVLEGYGLTETAPVVTTNPPEDIRPGTLGVPVPDEQVAIDTSVTDAAQFEDVDGVIGELLVRGPNVAAGYWNNERATADSFIPELPESAVVCAGDPDGEGQWFRTGDIIEATDEDYLIYHDRIKELLVLSTGKNVAPQPIEDAFATNDRVDQIMVVGDGEKFIGGLIVPNFDAVRRWAESQGYDLPADDDAVCEDERVIEWVGEAVENENEDLERIERVKEFALVSREWTAENDLLTPSMKKKRRNIKARFADKFEEIYTEDL
jgi:long-chain acyl-CoA synthetase